MENSFRVRPACLLRVLASILLGLAVSVLLLAIGNEARPKAQAEPLPGGTPKLVLSTKTVTPSIVAPGNSTLTYNIRLVNTGAWTATAASLRDVLPTPTTYISNSLHSSGGQAIVRNGVLTWTGVISFDSAVEITFSVKLNSAYTSGQVVNSAVLSDAQIAAPITLTAVATVTEAPILSLSKSSWPLRPGPNKPLFYAIHVSNLGQLAENLPITLTDRVPPSTTLRSIGPDGFTSPISDVVTWTRHVTLALGQATVFTFAVNVGDVPSGTVIANADYEVTGPETGVTAGEAYTITVVKPILSLTKRTWPDPPGCNREMTYTLTLLNSGSLATGLVITDRIPAGVEYRRGGVRVGDIVSWTWPSLGTGKRADFTFTVYISDVMNIPIVNDDYVACCAEKVCQAGVVLTSVIGGPTFETQVILDPIAKKPGGGSEKKPVTPTLVVRNVGPGNAFGATALLKFVNISVGAGDLYAIPAVGTPPPFPVGPSCSEGQKCLTYVWVGDVAQGQSVTFTTHTGQSTTGGNEGNMYTATIVITDSLANTTTLPFTSTAVGQITHYANVIAVKSAPPVIGRGQLLTYTIHVWNSALATLLPPILTDTVPASTTFAWASDGGVTRTISGTLVVSWTLPVLSPGEETYRTFAVRVDNDLVSGTHLVNDKYAAFGYGNVVTDVQAGGPPVTTTVLEAGLIDSFKGVTPGVALPGPGTLLTYYLHIVNSSALALSNVKVTDVLPWLPSTYQRDATASAGHITSDIVTLHWTGDVAPFSSEVVTFTVLVDPDYRGPVTNTAIISHPSLLDEVTVYAVAYVTDRPELRIAKSALPDPVKNGAELEYTLLVRNLGRPATALVITDAIPANTQYITDSATSGGQQVGDQIRWQIPTLGSDESLAVRFRVKVKGGRQVVNERYVVTCSEGATAVGAPLATRVTGGWIYLPLVVR